MPKSDYVSLPKFPSSSPFKIGDEYRYFDIFSTSTAYEIFPSVERGELRVMFPQASESEDAIRHAVIALGALDKTSQASWHSAQQPGADSIDSSNYHYQYALKHYSKAIKAAQSAVKQDLRTALMTSLTILSFEGWCGNHEMALQQIKIGQRLLKERNGQYGEPSVFGYSTSASLDVQHILLPIFSRLSFQVVSSTASQPPESTPKSCPALEIDDPHDVGSMPRIFTTLAEAEEYHNAILKFLLGFVSKGQPPIEGVRGSTRTYPVYVFPEPIPLSILQKKSTLSENVFQWLSAFAPLKSGPVLNTRQEKKAAMTLELQMRAAYMSVVTACARNESVYDDYLNVYEDIINISEELLNTWPSASTVRAPKFCFDTEVVIHLWSVGHKCRNPTLRRKVISLLLDYPRREGLWDSVFAANIIAYVMEFEEKYIEAGYVPEWARIRCAMFTVDSKRHSVEVEFQQRTSAGSSETVTRRKTIECYVRTGIGKPCCGGGTPAAHIRSF
jgi:hypothetical protein